MKNTELKLDAVRDAISFIPPDDRDLWVRIGMALKDEYGDDARDIWFDWSSTAKNYNEQSATHVWKSLNTGKVTIGSFIYEAKQFGWKKKRTDSVQVTPEEYARKQAERERRRMAEEEEIKRRAELAAKRAAEMWERAKPAESHPYLTRKGIHPHGARILDVWERKNTDKETGEITTVSVVNVLLIPLYTGPRTISSVQAVFPAHNDVLARDKDYLPGGTKQGAYYIIGTVTRATLRIIFCEGFATGCSIHEATGAVVVVCFDSGNLVTVAKAMRAKLPDVEMIIAGDNDLWTKNNPGATKANAAAFAVNGRIALPFFGTVAVGTQPTDFNDMHNHLGLEEVADQIRQATTPTDPEHYSPECVWAPPQPDAPMPQPEVGAADTPHNTGSTSQTEPFPAGDGAVQQQSPSSSAPTDDDGEHDDIEENRFFSVKGYDHDVFYIFQSERKQLATYTAGSFTDAGFISLAPLSFWETHFPADSGFNKRAALNWFVRLANTRGIFDPRHKRGRGAWVDRGRVVLHLGNKLIVDGKETEITDFMTHTRYVYELDRSLPALSTEALTSEEGEEILSISKLFRWNKPASAAMLAGWCALAPLCGALRWRPHIWLTGGAGTGKSWILNNFVYPLMNGMEIFAQGNSTEAGIRQTLRNDALPVLFDESEKNNEAEKKRVDGVLALIRQSSTESAARTLKGSSNGDAQQFHIRSMFCLASIQVGMEHQADYERLAVLSLRPKRDDDSGAGERWKRLQDRIYSLIQRDELLPSRLFRRSLDLLPVTLQNIDVFATAAAEKFGSQRDGDQYGTLMAGAWSLISTQVATPSEAREMLDSYEWQDYMDHTDSDDSIKALSAVMGAHVRMPTGLTVTIHELLLLSQHQLVDGIDNIAAPAAEAMLGRYGIKIEGDELLFANSCNALHGLIAHTPYASDLKGQLMRVLGAKRHPKPIYVSGVTTRAVSIPLHPLVASVKNLVNPADPYDDRPF